MEAALAEARRDQDQARDAFDRDRDALKERLVCAESTEKALRSRLDAEAGAAERLGED